MLANRSIPHGTIIPELFYDNLDAAVAWLCQTFGFQEWLRIGEHRSQLVFGGESIIAASSGQVRGTPPEEAPLTHSIMVRVPDVDAHYRHAVECGAQVLSPPETYLYGERQYTVMDIGGHRWTFTQSVADVVPEE